MALAPTPARHGLDSEYGRLTDVLLYTPGPEIGGHPDPPQVLHLAPIDAPDLRAELAALARTFADLGVQVHPIDPTPLGPDRRYLYNLMYCRDLLFMTPAGAILANMGVAFRAEEVRYARRALAERGVPVVAAVTGDGTFEGADALWLRPDRVVVGVGRRTNAAGFEQVRAALRAQGVECLPLPFDGARTQHLLGTVQLVDRDLALVRRELAAPDTLRVLREGGVTVVPVPESDEVRTRQAMNVVTVAPRAVLMSAGCPETRALYVAAGLTIAAELDITQLARGAGGLACAVGVLARDSVRATA